MKKGIGDQLTKRAPISGRGSLVERAAEQLGAIGSISPLERPSRDAPIRPLQQPRDSVVSVAPTNKATARIAEINLVRLRSAGILTPDVDCGRTLEEFRIIKRSVLQIMRDLREQEVANANVVMITSTRPGEGKTFTAINLAMSMALERDYSVLLVDADVSRPSILKSLGLTAEKGLIDILEDRSLDLDDVLIHTNVHNLSVLPVIRSDHRSTEFLASNRMSELIEEIQRRQENRIIIFDAPPVLATSEPAALAAHVGHVIFTVEANRTTKASIREALGLLGNRAPIGFVLNRAEKQMGSVYFGSYYDSYSTRGEH